MVALLKERPRAGVAVSTQPQRAQEEAEGGWRRRMRDRKAAAAAGTAGIIPGRPPETVVQEPDAVSAGPERMDPQTMPPVPPVRPVGSAGPVAPGAVGGDTINASTVAPAAGAYAAGAAGPTATHPVDVPAAPDGRPPVASTYDDVYADENYDDEPFGVLSDRELDEYQRGPYTDAGPATEETDTTAPRRRLLVIGLPLLALAVVIGLALWIGNTLLSVTGSVDDTVGSTPSGGGASSSAPAEEEPEAAGGAVSITGAQIFDPFGDGEPENNDAIPQSFDGDPGTVWSTLTYRGSPAFGNLKPGVGVVYDLGSEQELAGVSITSTTPGATVEIRTGDSPDAQLDSYATAGSGEVEGTTEFTFDEAVTARFVLVWVTGLVEAGDGFSADLAEVTVLSAG
jgi:hypothetical protein